MATKFRPGQVQGWLGKGLIEQDLFRDDFIGGGSTGGLASIPNLSTFGVGNWRVSALNAGLVQLVATDLSPTVHGVVQLSTLTNANSSAGIGRFPSGGTVFGRIVNNLMRFRWNWKHINISAVSSAAERYALHYGWGAALSAVPTTDALYFTYSDNINGGNWRFVSMKGGVATNVDSTVAVAINTPYLLSVEWDGVTLTVLINNVVIGTVASANIPAGQICEFMSMIRQTVTAGTQRDVRADYYDHDINWGDTGRG